MRRILLAEDQGIAIIGMNFLIRHMFPNYSMDVVKSCAELDKKLKVSEYHLAIIDLQLENGIVIHSLSRLLKNHPKTRVLVFSASKEEIVARPLYTQGIRGYLTKDADEEEIVEAISCVLTGNIYLSQHFKRLVIKRVKKQDMIRSELTETELQILLLLMKGNRGVEISSMLNLKPSTISNAKRKIFQKLKVKNLLELQKLMSSSQYHNNG